MALVLKDRISETTTTTGTGTITLGGATPGFQPFSSIGDTNTTYYCVTSGAAWEVGIGTYASSGNTLARTTILANSNNNTSPITLGAGTKVVFSVYPADRAVVVDGTTIQIPNNAVLPVANGGTGSNTAAFSGANITDLNATAITAGTIANNRTTASSSNGASTIVQRDAAGDFSANIITANSYSGSGASLTSLNASSISSGTLGVANGGTGAATLDANSVILGNGTSAVQFVAPGTSSNVLTSNGTTWVSQAPAAGGGGSYVYLGSATASSSTTVEFTGLDTTTYNGFIVYFGGVRHSTGAGGNQLRARVYINGTIMTTSNYYWGGYQTDTANSATYTGPFMGAISYFAMYPSTQAASTTAGMCHNGYLMISNVAGSGLRNFAAGQGSGNIANSATSVYSWTWSATLTNTTGVVNGIQFFCLSGNMPVGNFKIYGIKNS